MLLSERLFVLSVVLCSVVLCEKDTKRKGRHFLALLGYLHGYKIGQDFALHIPQYFITPIIIAPSVNQQQSVNIQQANNDENFQEISETVQTIAPAKILSTVNASTSKEDDVTDIEKLNDDIEVPIIKKPTKLDVNNTKAAENLTGALRQSMNTNANKTTSKNGTNIDQILSINITSQGIIDNVTDSVTEGPYPLPSYNNQMINSLKFTTKAPSAENSQSLPPVVDNRWQNFTLRANLSGVIPVENNNSTITNEPANNTTPLSFSTEYPKGSKGPYPSAWYNNEAIDQLSITTNYYTNESPLPTNDGWGSYTINTLPSGFKPLAGLYYDGFLHTPVKKYGFVPKKYFD